MREGPASSVAGQRTTKKGVTEEVPLGLGPEGCVQQAEEEKGHFRQETVCTCLELRK